MAFIARAPLYSLCKNLRQNRALAGRWRPSGPCRPILSPKARNAVAVLDGGHVSSQDMFSLPSAVHNVILAKGELEGIIVAAYKIDVIIMEMKRTGSIWGWCTSCARWHSWDFPRCD